MKLETRNWKLKTELGNISSKTLSLRLKDLETYGLVSKNRFKEIPPRVEYKLTQAGKELIECFEYLDKWAFKWIK